MTTIVSSEFDLHVLKRSAVNGRPDLFTIGVWDGVLTIRAVCHVLPIDQALTVLRQILETAGYGAIQASGMETGHEPRAASDRR